MAEQPIKIQLNSEAAIRSIIEGDPELQIEIKNKISCAIANGYEKINTQAVSVASNSLAQTIKEQLYADLTERESVYKSKRYLKNDVKKLIDEYTNRAISSIVWEIVDKRDVELNAQITGRVNEMAERIVNKIMDRAFENSVEAEVVRRLGAIQKTIDAEMKKKS